MEVHLYIIKDEKNFQTKDLKEIEKNLNKEDIKDIKVKKKYVITQNVQY